MIILLFVSGASWFIRYRFLNVYTRLPQEPPRKEPQIDLFPDSADGDSKPGFGQYFDEVLSAIKVFGYLERPVFYELTRTVQTKKLIAGETLMLEEEKGFCLVVDGIVQIFVKSLMENTATVGDSVDTLDDEVGYHEGSQGYQLLTEVKNGASMSSLFSILSLFTEDVNLRIDESSRPPSAHGFNNTTPGLLQTSTGPSTPARENSAIVSPHDARAARLSNVPPLNLETSFEEDYFRHKSVGLRKAQKQKSVHPDIVARATVDTTIAIIPASAFRRLTRIYPKATAHIIQVILARLHRVTLSTAHQYLGLTTEVLQIEKLMNKYTSYDLPNLLRGGALDRLRDKFAKEVERLGSDDITKGIALHNPITNRRRSSTGLRKEAALAARVAAARQSATIPDESTSSDVNAGDLATNASSARNLGRAGSLSFRGPQWSMTSDLNVARAGGIQSPLSSNEKRMIRPSFENGSVRRQDSVNEDTMLRESVLDCMVKALGLEMNAKDVSRRTGTGGASVEQSPRLVSYDARKQTAIFSNAFGMMNAYDESADGDSESVMSSSVASLAGHGARNMHDELIDDVEIVFFPKGSVLVEQGERNPGVYYVVDGFLDVCIPIEEKKQSTVLPNGPQEKRMPALRRTKTAQSRASSVPAFGADPYKKQVQRSLFLVKPGGIAGYIGTLSSHRSLTDVVAKTDVYVGFIPRQSLERVAEKYPILLLTMAKRLTSLLPRLILHIDFALEWLQVDAGQVIHRQGDDSDAIYIVLNGRLRAVKENADGSMRSTGEYGQGESIGELEVMTEDTRPATLHAIRETELCKFPRSLFNSLAQEHPSITIQISKLIAQRMRALVENPANEDARERRKLAIRDNSSSNLNLRTIAVLPVTAGVPVVEFGNRLLAALTQVGVPSGVTSLNQAIVLNHLGRHAFSRLGKLKLSQYLTDLEEKYGMVLYIADTNVNSPWTQTCVKQADCILLIGLAEGSPSMGEYERFLLSMKTTARKDLVLLHREKFSKPGLTSKWLRNRGWINGGHHHIHMAFRTQSENVPIQPRKQFGTAIKKRVEVIQAEIQKYTSRRVRQQPLFSADTPFKGDFHRLARRLCGRSVGLVLGGGGARGISHVGVIRALEEAGIPVDLVGGTSIGAFIGGLYARDAEVVSMYGRAKRFAGRMGSMWRFALDLTYPSVSYTTGHEFNRGIYKTFGNSQIEDFWISFYCNTTNISKSRAEIHTSGYAWRYIRASMTLAGMIPPICDEGSMLLDGGYIDNLTVAHMKSLGADLVFAVDVGSLDDDSPQDFGDSLSGFWAVLQRWNPFSTAPNPPSLSEIQGRLAYVSSVDALERAKASPGVLYMRPPIDAYATLDFAKFDEIYEVGYAYAKEFINDLKAKGELQGVSTLR